MKIHDPDQKTSARLPSLLSRGALGMIALTFGLTTLGQAQTILGTTGGYGVMGGGVVTVTGVGTTITGDLGAGSLVGSVTFGSSGVVVTPLAAQNTTDFNRVYAGLAAMTMTQDLTLQTLGTSVNNLLPGVYKFTSAAALTGNLVLDANGQPNAVWVFQMGSTFNTTAAMGVTIINTIGDPVANYGLFWQVAGATTIGANTALKGNLITGGTISFGAGATIIDGRALTATGTIGLATNTINFAAANSGYAGGLAFVDSGTTLTAVPEPATYALFAAVATLGFAAWRRRATAQAKAVAA